MATHSIEFPNDVEKWLKTESDKQFSTISRFIRNELIKKYLETQEKGDY